MLAKPVDQWTVEDVEQLLHLGERQLVEFKASSAIARDDAFRNECSKDISSFLNSSGGYIVFGIAEDKKRRVFEIDAGVDVSCFPKEWLEDVVLAGIKPRPGGIAIKPINLSPARALYVLRIDEGTTAYQARDKKYYKRFNFKAEPLEDHEVKFLVGKVKTPLVELQVRSKTLLQGADLHRYEVCFSLWNKGAVRASDVKAIIHFPNQFICRIGQAFARVKQYVDRAQGLEYSTMEYYGIGNPIFPDETLNLEDFGDHKLEFQMNRALYGLLCSRPDLDLNWTVFAGDAVALNGSVPIANISKF